MRTNQIVIAIPEYIGEKQFSFQFTVMFDSSQEWITPPKEKFFEWISFLSLNIEFVELH